MPSFFQLSALLPLSFCSIVYHRGIPCPNKLLPLPNPVLQASQVAAIEKESTKKTSVVRKTLIKNYPLKIFVST